MGFLRRSQSATPIPTPFSKRSVVNLSYINDVAHYPFINHILEGDNFAGPYGAPLTQGPKSWMEMIDLTTGYPNDPYCNGKVWGGSMKLPDTSKFAGPYVITWDGTGTLILNSATWTETNNVSGQPGFGTYTRVSNGVWSNVAGKSAYIIATASGFAGAPNIFPVQFSATGGADGYVRNFRVYRLADESDLLTGWVFRRAYLQQIVDHDPSALRVMNWSAGNNAQGMRFENRTLPTDPSYGNSANWLNSPVYGTTTGTNQYVLPMITTGVRQTPAALQHGEIVMCRIGSSSTGGSYGNAVPVVSVTLTATPHVVTGAPHGFVTGQLIFHDIPAGNGVPKLDRFPCTISNITSTGYDITNISLVGQAAYVANSGGSYVYASLDVGGRKMPGDASSGGYPIVFPFGATGANLFGPGYLAQNDHKVFYFDKNVIGKSDGAGNYIKGAWIFTDGGVLNAHWDGVPLEILTKLIVELNQMGPKNPISLWVCYPHRSLLSELDPDYTSASSWSIQATNVILNGNTVGGVTYPGLLTGAPGANLYIEYANEIWNPTPQKYYHQWYAQTRWGVQSVPDAHALRATAMARDIRAAYPAETRIKLIMGMWAAKGCQPGADGGNYGLWNGSSTPGTDGYLYTNDSVASAWGPPKNYFDGLAIAPYFEPGVASYYEATGTGSFVDDSAMYAGTSPYSSPNQAQAVTNFINKAKNDPTGGPSLSQLVSIYDQFVGQVSASQFVTNYEGGPNWMAIKNNLLSDNHTITAADEAFLVNTYRSAQLGTALTDFFNTVCAKPRSAMPSIYLSVNAGYRWTLGAPDSYGTTSIEGGSLTTNPAWVALNSRNASVR